MSRKDAVPAFTSHPIVTQYKSVIVMRAVTERFIQSAIGLCEHVTLRLEQALEPPGGLVKTYIAGP